MGSTSESPGRSMNSQRRPSLIESALRGQSPAGRHRQPSRVREVTENFRRAIVDDEKPVFQGRTALMRWHVKQVEQMTHLVKEAALELPPGSPTLSAGRKRLQQMRGLPLDLFVLPPTPRISSLQSKDKQVRQPVDDSGRVETSSASSEQKGDSNPDTLGDR